jgi:hypothetical protein
MEAKTSKKDIVVFERALFDCRMYYSGSICPIPLLSLQRNAENARISRFRLKMHDTGLPCAQHPTNGFLPMLSCSYLHTYFYYYHTVQISTLLVIV